VSLVITEKLEHRFSGKRRLKMKKLATYLSVTILAAMLSILALVWPAAATDLTYSFTLTGPQVAEDPNTSNTIRVTGSGSFDTSARTVIGSGSFAMFNSGGAVISRGTWNATSFVSFDSFGGFSPGFQGGVLKIIVTLSPDAGTAVTGVSMTVTCRVNAPSNFKGDEGIIIGSFTKTIAGHTLFHLND
jgi:hypothetical protein